MLTQEYIENTKKAIDQITDPVVRLRELNRLNDEIELDNLRLMVEAREAEFNRTVTEINQPSRTTSNESYAGVLLKFIGGIVIFILVLASFMA